MILKNKKLNDIEFVVGVSRGGLIPAVLLSTKINKPLVTVYIDKQDNIYFDRPEWLENKNVLVVDDIVRSGKTLDLISKYFKNNVNTKSISFMTLFSIKGQNKYNIPVISEELTEDTTFPWDYDRI